MALGNEDLPTAGAADLTPERLPPTRHVRLELVEFRDFDLSGLGSGAKTTIWLAQNVPVASFRNGHLLVRVKSSTIVSGRADFDLVFVAPTGEDPSNFYRDVAVSFPSGSVKLNFSGSGFLASEVLTTEDVPLPAFVSLRLVVEQGTANDALSFEVSVALDLVD